MRNLKYVKMYISFTAVYFKIYCMIIVLIKVTNSDDECPWMFRNNNNKSNFIVYDKMLQILN